MTQEEVMRYWQQANKDYLYIVWQLEHDFTEQKEIKMTRQEAIKIMDSDPSFSGAAWIARFEALGLIKFDKEEKKESTAKQIIAAHCDYADDLLKELTEAGYRIVKIGKNTTVKLAHLAQLSDGVNGKLIDINQ